VNHAAGDPLFHGVEALEIGLTADDAERLPVNLFTALFIVVGH
jgi:hypothetical protein